MTISQTQATALATFVAKVRDDWDQPGILAAIQKAQTFGNPLQIGRALLALAENRALRTPALLASPGKHWVHDGEPVGPNVTNNVRCPEHPINFHPCPLCAAKKCPPDPVEHADYLKAKAELASRRPIPTVQKRLADFAAQKENKS
jgi:hypothetical protein